MMSLELTKLSLDTWDPTIPVLCYTCLVPKTVAGFISIMHTGNYSGGGPKAQYRMCKDCMMRKHVRWLYGRWWREGPHIPEYTSMAFPVKISIADRLLGRSRGLREQDRLRKRLQDRGVCGKCRREKEVLFWGCGNCFRTILDGTRCQDIASRNFIDQIIYRMQNRCVHCIDW